MSVKNVKPNAELVKLLKEGDMAAFDAIYNQYCHKLHQFVFIFLKQKEDAEGIAQEVFIKIWESLDSNKEIFIPIFEIIIKK